MVNKILSVILVTVLLAMSLSSCALRDSGTAPSVGVGKDTVSVIATGDSQSEETPDDTKAPEASGSESADSSEPEESEDGEEALPTAGKYNVPKDLSFLNNIQKGHFVDKNADDPNGCWYPGKTVRDLTTGTVEYKWDRDQSTLDLIDKYEAIYRGNDEKKYVYLTFDCGYEYRNDQYPDGVTNDILDTLKEKNAPGTFFVTGDYLKTDSDIVERMLDEGHIVGNHTLNHYNMTTLTPENFVEQIDANNRLLKEKIPTAPDMVFYRPPEGGANEWTLALAQKMGLYTCFWSATVADYNTSNQPDPVATLTADKTML
ncbi:MAG: polysaccharide deacetylase family protein, partial [Clostridia bacterium]|nr:polysaccharide deacetylase family protein [Clostridia bacterium]